MNRRWARALLALPLLWLIWGLSLRRIALPTYVDTVPQQISGVFHVHSDASHDCLSKASALRDAAVAANVQFVVLTDHNVRASTLCDGDDNIPCLLSYSELSTLHGHLIALGATQPLDRRFRKQASVVEATRALSATPIVAHPSDAKRPWTGPWEGVMGLEVANLASSARRRGGPAMLGLVPLLLAYPTAADLALMQLIDRDTAALQAWDARPAQPLAGLCALDAHGWIPSADIFRTWQMGLVHDVGGGANLAADLTNALRDGQFVCYNALLGQRPAIGFVARRRDGAGVSAAATLRQKDVTHLEIVAPRLSVGSVETIIFRNTQQLLRTAQQHVVLPNPSGGTYRAEFWAPLPTLTGATRPAPIAYTNRLVLTD